MAGHKQDGWRKTGAASLAGLLNKSNTLLLLIQFISHYHRYLPAPKIPIFYFVHQPVMRIDPSLNHASVPGIFKAHGTTEAGRKRAGVFTDHSIGIEQLGEKAAGLPCFLVKEISGLIDSCRPWHLFDSRHDESSARCGRQKTASLGMSASTIFHRILIFIDL